MAMLFMEYSELYKCSAHNFEESRYDDHAWGFCILRISNEQIRYQFDIFFIVLFNQQQSSGWSCD